MNCVRACDQTTGSTPGRHGIATKRGAQYTRRLPPSALPGPLPHSGLPLFVNSPTTDFSSRDSALTGQAPADSAGLISRTRSPGQQRDTSRVIGGLIEVLLRSLEVPIAFVAPLSDVMKWPESVEQSKPLPDAGDASGDLSGLLLIGRDTPLAETLAQAVRESGAPLLIEDTRTHPLVRGVEPVRGVRVLACLAVPVLDQRGQVVAALCALDGVPRWWMDTDVTTLTRMADAMGALLNAPAPASTARHTTRPHQHRLDVDVRADKRNSVADTLFDSMPDGAMLIDRGWTVRWHNSSLAELLNVPAHLLEQTSARDLLGSYADSVVLARWQRALDTDAADVAVWHHRASDRWLEAHAWPAANGLAIVLRDISAHRQAALANERRAGGHYNARSFSVIEQLAGGVAHDFNNLLTVIRANAELMQFSPAADDIDVELQEIQRAARRATEITQQLLAFGQQQLLEPARISINHALAALEPSLRTLLPENIRVESSLSTASTTVLVDPTQLREVVLQMIRNARDAMPDGGVVSLVTDTHLFDAPKPCRPFPVPAGQWVSFSVCDTGSGIAPEHLDRVFEPFFTTRDVGSGVGLGLSTVFGVVAQSGGLCSIESEPGLGTTLAIWLPAIDPVPARQAARAPNEPDSAR